MTTGNIKINWHVGEACFPISLSLRGPFSLVDVCFQVHALVNLPHFLSPISCSRENSSVLQSRTCNGIFLNAKVEQRTKYRDGQKRSSTIASTWTSVFLHCLFINDGAIYCCYCEATFVHPVYKKKAMLSSATECTSLISTWRAGLALGPYTPKSWTRGLKVAMHLHLLMNRRLQALQVPLVALEATGTPVSQSTPALLVIQRAKCGSPTYRTFPHADSDCCVTSCWRISTWLGSWNLASWPLQSPWHMWV